MLRARVFAVLPLARIVVRQLWHARNLSGQRKLRPEFAPSRIRPPAFERAAAPLLEEEGDALRLAVVAQLDATTRAHRAVPRTGLAAGDQPVDAGQVEAVERAEQRLGAR